MKILLVGEFSRLHNSLKEGLLALGHEVVLVNNGDGFKNFPADISIRANFFKSKLGNIPRQIWFKIFKYDLVLLEQYKQYIYSNNIERISFESARNNIDEVLSNSSIFCLTSQSESFSMILLECKESALPAISYDCPNGPRHIIENDGVLIEHNNIDNFTEKLEGLMNDENLRKQMAENAFDNKMLFSSKEIIKKWNKLL